MPSALDAVLAAAKTEVRISYSLARTWLFVVLGSAAVLTAYGYYFHVHSQMSAPAPSMGYFSPRFNASAINVYLLWIFLAAAAFLAFDVSERDRRARIVDVVDCRPVSNLALLIGRLLGLLCVTWVPILTTILVVQLFGTVSRVAGWWLGEPVEPFAQTAFLLIDGIPILAFWIAFVLVLADLLRNRLWSIAVASAGLGLQMWAYTTVPVSVYAAISPLSAQVGWASDLVPRFVTAEIVVQRSALVVLAAALLCVAAVGRRRNDGAHVTARVGAAVGLAALGSLGIVWATLQGGDDLRAREQWRAAHRAAAKAAGTLADVERIAGEIAIRPGEGLALDARMRLSKPSGLKALVFSFNPGMRLEHLSSGTRALHFSHEDGLLVIELPPALAAAEQATIALRATGVPDGRFAHLDTPVEWLDTPPANQLTLLGTEAGLFERNFVALLPATMWLPMAGANWARDSGGADFFTVELIVESPQGWLVAGPGRREEAERQDQTPRVRFRPDSPVPEVGVIAGRFDRFAATVQGIHLELLLHRGHLRTARFFADAVDVLVAEIEERFSAVEALGIGYPLGALSVVEVPSRIRGYRGGWRMDTAMAMPGLLMVKEHGLPTARFDGPSALKTDAETKMSWLRGHTSNDDMNGSDVLRGVAHNLFATVTRARGHGADALNFVCSELAFRLLTERNVPFARAFSAHRFDVHAHFGATFARAAQGLATGSNWPVLRLFNPYVDRHSIWTLAGTTSLADLEHHEESGLATDALHLRATAVARAMYDGLGRERAAAVLAELRRRFQGRTFDASDFASVAAANGVDFNVLLGDWLDDPGLPGFLVSQSELFRLPDEDGQQRYQARVHVRNDEPVPGVVHLSADRWGYRDAGTIPVRVPGSTSAEVGLVVPEPPNQLWLHPYGSLNRTPIRVRLPSDLDATEIVDETPLEGARESDWRPDVRGVVVDDLDADFTTNGNPMRRTKSAYGDWEIEVDHGLPVAERQRGEWIRAQVPSAAGKYRHTAALVRPGDGDRHVVFEARLPRPGRWQMDYHIPNRHAPPPTGWSAEWAITFFGALGNLDMHLQSGADEKPVSFDAGAAEVGWNKVGEFDLEAGDVRLVVTNRTDGEIVVADAIRWSRVDGSREP